MLRLASRLAPFLMFGAVVFVWHFVIHRAITHAVAVLDAASKVTP